MILAARKEAEYWVLQNDIGKIDDLELDVAESLRDLIEKKLATSYVPVMEWQNFRMKLLDKPDVCQFFTDKNSYLARFYRNYCELKNAKQ